MLTPIPEAVSQICSSRLTTVQTPHEFEKVFSTPTGGPGSTRPSKPKLSSGLFFTAPEISVVTNTPPDARTNGGQGTGPQ